MIAHIKAEMFEAMPWKNHAGLPKEPFIEQLLNTYFSFLELLQYF